MINETIERLIDVAFDHLSERIKEMYDIAVRSQKTNDEALEATFYLLYMAPISKDCEGFAQDVKDLISGHDGMIKFFIDINYLLQSKNYEHIKDQQFFDAAFTGQICEIPTGPQATKIMIEEMRAPLRIKFFEAVKELDTDLKYLKDLDADLEVSRQYDGLSR